MEERKRKIAILRHNDLDGFGAAYAVWKALKDTCELLFIPVQYGQEPPYEELSAFGPDKVYIVDFSYKASVLKKLNAIYPDLTVFDHHVSALPELRAWCNTEETQHVNSGGGSFFYSSTQSGCMLVWDMFHLDRERLSYFPSSLPTSEILLYVQDMDLWKFELENSKEINAYIATLPEDFEVWDDFYLPEAYTAGRAVLAFQNAQIERRLKDVVMMYYVRLNPYEPEYYVGENPHYFIRSAGLDRAVPVPFLNCSENHSEVGAALNAAYPDSLFSVTYCDRADGKRSYSLRSNNGFDVSEVAKAFGGGGHPGAAGFTLDALVII